jgi:endoglycosylceramidase
MFRDDKDLSTLKQGKADVLIRTYPQATAGTPLALSFDAATGRFSYSYAPSAAAKGPTEIFVPQRHYPNGYDVLVSGAKVISAPGSALLILENLPAAVEVSVEVRAR